MNFNFVQIYSGFGFAGTEIIIDNADTKEEEILDLFKCFMSSFDFAVTNSGKIILFFKKPLKKEFKEYLFSLDYKEEKDNNFGFGFKYVKQKFIKTKLCNSEKIKMCDLNNFSTKQDSKFIKEKINKIEQCVFSFNCFYDKYKKYPESISSEDIIYQIFCAAWLRDSLIQLEAEFENKGYTKKIKELTLISKELEYIEALRSISAAHPFTTTRHETFGFDGNYACTDFFINYGAYASIFKEKDIKWKYMNFDGLKDIENNSKEYDNLDILLKTKKINSSDNKSETIIIGIKIKDIEIAYKRILEELDKYNKSIEKET